MSTETEHLSNAHKSLWSLAFLGILVCFSGLLAWLKVKPINRKNDDQYPDENDSHNYRSLTSVSANGSRIREPEVDKSDSTTKRWKLHPYLKFGVNVLTMLAVVWYAYEARRQRLTMDSSFNQTRQQTTLLQRQTEAAMAAIVTKQFRITWPEKRAFLSVILDNKGRVIASGIAADFKLSKVSLPDRRVIETLPDWKCDFPEILPSPDLPVERGTYLSTSPEELTGHQGMPKAIRMTGSFSYFNGFVTTLSPICNYILGPVEFRDKSRVVRQTSGPTVVTCDSLTPQIAQYLETQRSFEK